MKKYYIKYLDINGKPCNTKSVKRKYVSVDAFIEECQKYGIKWEHFKNIELMEDD